MRLCANEGVDVYEASGDKLGPLLREAADLVDTCDEYMNVHTTYDFESGYIVTVYLSGQR